MAPRKKDDRILAEARAAQPPQPLKSGKPKSQVLLNALGLLVSAGLSSPISQLNLSPVYGSIPASLYHAQGITFVALIAYVARRRLKQETYRDYYYYIAPWLYWTPVIQFLLFPYSEDFGPLWGPIATEAATFYPVLFLSFLSVGFILDDLDLQKFGSRVSDATPAVFSYGVFSLIQQFAATYLPRLLGTTDFFTRTGLQLLNASLAAFFSKSVLLALAVPAVLHTMFSNPHYYGVGPTRLVNQTLFEYQYAVLERRDSMTGYLSVIKNKKDGFLALRCDHSLLGGEWLITPARQRLGQETRDTIYGVFTMLEAVRLIKSEVYAPDDEKDALFIGLGVGSAPKAFIAHGLNTTIVEIDPVVHEFATKYFELPEDHTKVIGDAVSWANKQAIERPESYDYIVHDVFTGGAEPTSLFTYEFLQDLSLLLKEDGAIAINYAGDIDLPPPRIILNTIFSVFPSCKVYRDTIPEPGAETFLNMVVYCIKQPKDIEWRLTTNEDYLGSMARRQFLPPDEGHELILANIGGGSRKWTKTDILTRGNESIINDFHAEASMKHWRIMRTVLPGAVWENW